MRLKEARSASEGLERSCQRTVAGWLASSKPAGGVELFSAWFAAEAYQKHRHDTYAIGVTDSGVQAFDYRGAVHASTPGQVVVLYPDEAHDGRAGAARDSATGSSTWNRFCSRRRYGHFADGPLRCRS